MATSVHRPCLVALAVGLILLCAPLETAQFTFDPPWSDEYWANEPLIGDAAEAASVAAKRAEAGGYARLWLARGCPPAPGKGVNGSLVDGRRSYDRELDRFEEGLRRCSHRGHDSVPLNPEEQHLRHTYPAITFDTRCCICCLSCARY